MDKTPKPPDKAFELTLAARRLLREMRQERGRCVVSQERRERRRRPGRRKGGAL